MFVLRQANILLLAVALVVSASCAPGQTHEEAMQLFVEQKNMTIREKTNIEAYLNPRLGFALEGMHEVQPGVVEYAFTMIGWKYNNKPEYCTANG